MLSSVKMKGNGGKLRKCADVGSAFSSEDSKVPTQQPWSEPSQYCMAEASKVCDVGG